MSENASPVPEWLERDISTMDADDVMDLLNDYFSALIEIIFQHNGTVDKINGDGIFAVFGSPEPDPLRYERAARAGLKMQATMSEVSQKRRSRGQVTCAIGIGIHCGEILHESGRLADADLLCVFDSADAVAKSTRMADAGLRICGQIDEGR